MEKDANCVEPFKKPYQPPTIRVYGDLAAITSAADFMTMVVLDGAKTGFPKIFTGG